MRVIDKKSDQPVCDFCIDYSRVPRWKFKAKPDIMEISNPASPGTDNVVLQSHPDGRSTVLVKTKGVIVSRSVGNYWACCDRCKKYIDDKRMHDLAWLSTAQYITNHNIRLVTRDDMDILKERIFNVQQAFWRNYDGSPAEPLPETNN